MSEEEELQKEMEATAAAVSFVDAREKMPKNKQIYCTLSFLNAPSEYHPFFLFVFFFNFITFLFLNCMFKVFLHWTETNKKEKQNQNEW